MKKIKENIENISKYSDFKILCSLTKPHSSIDVVCLEDKDDDRFIHIIYYYAKSGKITDSSLIIASDYPSWIRFLENNGYEIKK